MKAGSNAELPAYVYARRFALPAWLILGIILLLGLVWRLAYVRAQGFPNDISSFEAWAITLVAHGPSGFYASTNFIDYPPGYFYILGIVGQLWSLLFSAHDTGYAVLAVLVKLPAILFDLGLGVLIYAIARRFGSEKLALGAAALYVLNPAVIFVSALWGQVDSVACFFALLGVYALLRSDDFETPKRARYWIIGGWIALAYSLLIKPQASVLVPLFIAFAFANRERRELRLWSTAYGIIAAIIFTIVVVEPFYPSNPIAAVLWLLQRLSFGTNVYAYNSVNAFNLWALHFWGGANGLFWQQDSTLIGFIPQWLWGIILVLVAVALVVWRYLQLQTPQALLQAAAIALLGFFTLATRMHERYVYDGVIFTIACLPIARRYLWIALGLSIVFWSNLTYSYQYIAVMTAGQGANQGVNAADLWGLWSSTFALANVIMFFYLGYAYLGETVAKPDLLGSVRNWFDPREGLSAFRKPLDHVVMWALGIASFILSLRIPTWYWKPTDKIFDEVYFARAAEEYLHNYRIYENTHPPLTKLLITLSTWMFGGLYHGGDHSWGWRFLDVVFGALVVMLLYAFARRITGSTVWAAVAAVFFICDGMHYVQSRIATPEGFVVFFSLAAVYAFYRFWIASQAEERAHVNVPPWLYLAGASGAIACGIVAMLVLDGVQHWILGWPTFNLWDSVSGGRTQGPGPAFVCAFYFACGFYLLFRNVFVPRYYADGAHEETFAEGSYALQRGASEMHVVDGGVVGKGKAQQGALTKAKGGALAYNYDGLEISYTNDTVQYAAPPGAATYAAARTAAENGNEDGRHAKLWLLLFTLALGALVSSKWYGVMGFGVSFLLLILIWLQRYVVLAPASSGVEGGINLRPALWGNPRGFRIDGALVTILFVSMTVYGLIWLPDLIRQSPDPNEIHNINDVVARQYNMFDYHDHLVATHPYASKWFEWPFDEVPVAYYYQDHRSDDHRLLTQNQKCCIYEVTSLPNPLNLWFGLVCVPLVGILAWRQRNKAYALLVVTYVLQWLPWMRTPRLAWEYHFYVDIPLICLCNTIILQRVWEWASRQRGAGRGLGRGAVIAGVCLIVAAFIFFLPVLSAWPLSYEAWQARMWFTKWVIGPG